MMWAYIEPLDPPGEPRWIGGTDHGAVYIPARCRITAIEMSAEMPKYAPGQRAREFGERMVRMQDGIEQASINIIRKYGHEWE